MISFLLSLIPTSLCPPIPGIKASDKSPLASKASPQDFPVSPSRRAILGRRFGWPGRKRGAARGGGHHRLRRREREEDGETCGGETSGYFPPDSEASGGDTSGPTYSSLPSDPTSSPPSQADRHQGRRPSSPSEGHSSSASGGNDVFVSGSYSSGGHRVRVGGSWSGNRGKELMCSPSTARNSLFYSQFEGAVDKEGAWARASKLAE
jgi:hypothetical protein